MTFRSRWQRVVLAGSLSAALALTTMTVTSSTAEAEQVRLIGSEFATSTGDSWLEIPVPAGVREHDLLLAVVAVTSRRDVSGPDGWHLVRADSRSREVTQTLWVREAGPGEPDSYLWYGGTSRAKTGAILALGDAVLSDPASGVSAGDAYRSRPIVVPAVENSAHDALLVGAFSMAAHGKIEAPDMDLLDEVEAGVSTMVAIEQLTAPGETRERIAFRTASGGAVGHLMVVQSRRGVDAPSDDATPPSNPGDHGEPPPADHTDSHDEAEETRTETPPTDEDADDHDESEERHTEVPSLPGSSWHDTSTWASGHVPGPGDDVLVEGDVVIEQPARASTVRVAHGSTLTFAPENSASLLLDGNLVVEGTLRMRPSRADVEHVLRFVDVDETAFQGGGHTVVGSDVGLWFVGHGRADIAGSDRSAWLRAANSLERGDRVIQLEQAPEGWLPGDEVLITPTSPPGSTGHSTGYSGGRLVAVSGDMVELDTPLTYSHPRVKGLWGAEVMNVTRNVRIEGTPGGHAHVQFLHTHTSQHLRNASLRYLGPRQDSGDSYRSSGQRIPIYEGVLGRYPLHFHHNGSGSAGTIVDNVVVRDSGNRAFVAHASDGITFRNTIAHDVFDTPYWWDRRHGCCGRHAEWEPPSNNVTYERAVASYVKSDPPFRGRRLAGFELGHGENVAIRDSVAVGVQGNENAAGFKWPEGSSRDPDTGARTDINHWIFTGNVAHNNRMNGIFVWQNTSDDRHLIQTSVLYHNGQHGVDHGAYSNRYRYRDLELYGNGDSGVRLHAQGEMVFSHIDFDGAGISQYAFRTTQHRADGGPVVLSDSSFSGYTEYAIGLFAWEPTHLDVVNPAFAGPEATWFQLADEVPASSVIRVQLQDGAAFRLHPTSSDQGVPIPAWNARREPIPPFR